MTTAVEPGEALDALISAAKGDRTLDGPIQLGIQLDKEPETAPSTGNLPAVHLVRLAHRIQRKDDETVCLVVRDPGTKYSALVAKSPDTADLFDEVISVGKLRRRLRSKKNLALFQTSFSKIFVDERAYKPLAEALGPSFTKKAKTLPIPLQFGSEFDAESVGRQVRSTRKCSQLRLKRGTFFSLPVGHTRLSKERNLDNVVGAARQVRAILPGGRLLLKTAKSASLELDL